MTPAEFRHGSPRCLKNISAAKAMYDNARKTGTYRISLA
jgi:hypothetical protein